MADYRQLNSDDRRSVTLWFLPPPTGPPPCHRVSPDMPAHPTPSQVDVEQAGSAGEEAATHSSASDAGHLSPDTAGLCSQEPMMDGPQEVAADTKEILDRTVHREKPLRVGSRFEPAHLTLPLPGRLVRDFGPIVRVLVRAVDHGRHHGAAGRGVTAQFVGDQSSRGHCQVEAAGDRVGR